MFLEPVLRGYAAPRLRTASTSPLRTAYIRSWRFTAGSQWETMSSTVSPHRGSRGGGRRPLVGMRLLQHPGASDALARGVPDGAEVALRAGHRACSRGLTQRPDTGQSRRTDRNPLPATTRAGSRDRSPGRFRGSGRVGVPAGSRGDGGWRTCPRPCASPARKRAPKPPKPFPETSGQTGCR